MSSARLSDILGKACVFQKEIRRLTFISIVFLVTLVSTSCATSSVFAGSGLVSSVGGVTFVQGAKHFWVSQSRPTFSGLTTASGHVDVTIGSVKNGTTADASGNWSWTPAADLSGDNQITVATSSTSTTFTLTIGSLPASIASASANTLAPAGNISPTIVLLLGGTVTLTIGSLGFLKTRR